MGILSWLKGEPRVGDADYELYHRVDRQIKGTETCEDKERREREDRITRERAERR